MLARVVEPDVGHLRQFATDAAYVRCGLAQQLLAHTLDDAAANGVRRIEVLASKVSVPLYATLGLTVLGERTLGLSGGAPFEAVAMSRALG